MTGTIGVVAMDVEGSGAETAVNGLESDTAGIDTVTGTIGADVLIGTTGESEVGLIDSSCVVITAERN